MKWFPVLLLTGLVFTALALADDDTNDSQLDGFIRKALERNPGVQAMTHRVAAAEAGLRQARSAWLPRLNAGAAYTVTDNAPQAFMMKLNQRQLNMAAPGFDFNNPDDTENISLSVGINYRLYDGSRGTRIRGAAVGKEITDAQHQALLNRLVYTVTRGYYEVLQAQAFVTVQTAALASLEESLRVASERHASGSVVKTDVLNLEVKAAQAHENLIRAHNGVQLAIAALNTAIGADVVDDSGLPTPSLKPVAPAMISVDADVTRPEMRVGNLQAQAAGLQYKAARQERGPVLNGFGNLSWDSEDLSNQERSYLAGVALEWQWFSGFEQSAKIDEARQLAEAAEANREHLRRELALDQRQASLGLNEAWQRLQVTSQAVGSAEEALRITRAQYKEGAAEISVLLVAELGLTETHMRHTSAMYDYQIAKSNLERALGRLSTPYQ